MPAIVCSVITMRLRNSKRVRLLIPVDRSFVKSAKNWLSSSHASVGRISRSVRAFSRAQASEARVVLLRDEEVHDVALVAFRPARVEFGAVAGDVDQRQPARRDAARQVEQQVRVHADDARGVLRAFEVARQPIDVLDGAGEHGLTIRVHDPRVLAAAAL
jgi:hypothetical protein